VLKFMFLLHKLLSFKSIIALQLHVQVDAGHPG
jgi:hypothetical protein